MKLRARIRQWTDKGGSLTDLATAIGCGKQQLNQWMVDPKAESFGMRVEETFRSLEQHGIPETVYQQRLTRMKGEHDALGREIADMLKSREAPLE